MKESLVSLLNLKKTYDTIYHMIICISLLTIVYTLLNGDNSSIFESGNISDDLLRGENVKVFYIFCLTGVGLVTFMPLVLLCFMTMNEKEESVQESLKSYDNIGSYINKMNFLLTVFMISITLYLLASIRLIGSLFLLNEETKKNLSNELVDFLSSMMTYQVPTIIIITICVALFLLIRGKMLVNDFKNKFKEDNVTFVLNDKNGQVKSVVELSELVKLLDGDYKYDNKELKEALIK